MRKEGFRTTKNAQNYKRNEFKCIPIMNILYLKKNQLASVEGIDLLWCNQQSKSINRNKKANFVVMVQKQEHILYNPQPRRNRGYMMCARKNMYDVIATASVACKHASVYMMSA